AISPSQPMRRSRKQRDLREPSSTQPGSYLAFLVRIQTVDPSAFEMPDAPGKRSRGFFIFEGYLQDVR
ncbi:MAG: hypothetical protein WA712_18955, partial [Pseudolabrys sp.]